MKHIKFYLIALLAGLNLTSVWSALELKEAPTSGIDTKTQPPWQEVVQYARENLPLEGQLVIKADGFGYLKVDDEYIHTLFPMLGLANQGYRKPEYFRSADSPGAHISVFYVKENVYPVEAGQTFHFTLKDIAIVQPSKKASFAVLTVDAPELEALREKYGLPGKLNGHEFHISIAKKTIRHHKKYYN